MELVQPELVDSSDAVRREIADCDRKLARHRAALEAGMDPLLVTSWSADVQRQRAAAESRIAERVAATSRRMSGSEIKALVDALGGLLQILQLADPAVPSRPIGCSQRLSERRLGDGDGRDAEGGAAWVRAVRSEIW